MTLLNESQIQRPSKGGISIFYSDLDNNLYYKSSDNSIYEIESENGIYKIQSIEGLLSFNPNLVLNYTGEKIEVTKRSSQEYFFKIISDSTAKVIGGGTKTIIQNNTSGGGYPLVEFIPVITTGQTVFALSSPPNLSVKPILEVNGNSQRMGVDYNIVGNILTWLNNKFNLQYTDEIDLYYSN